MPGSLRELLRKASLACWNVAERAYFRRQLEGASHDMEELQAMGDHAVSIHGSQRGEPMTAAIAHCGDTSSSDYETRIRRFYSAPRDWKFGTVELEGCKLHPALGIHRAASGILRSHFCAWNVRHNPKYALPLHLLKYRTPRHRHPSGAFLAPSYHHNFYHWLVDILPRLQLLSGEEGPILVPRTLRKFALDYLDLAGAGQVQLLDKGVHQIERLTLPTNLTAATDYSIRQRDFHQERLLPAARAQAGASPSGKRIYVTRRDARVRRIRNEDALLKLLPGFEPVSMSGLTVAQQAVLFADADAIVAPHGAALANLVYCRPGTRVLEIFQAGHFNPCFARIAEMSDLRYSLAVGQQAGSDTVVPTEPSSAMTDFVAQFAQAN